MTMLMSKYGYLYHIYISSGSIGIISTDLNGLSYLWLYNRNGSIW